MTHSELHTLIDKANDAVAKVDFAEAERLAGEVLAEYTNTTRRPPEESSPDEESLAGIEACRARYILGRVAELSDKYPVAVEQYSAAIALSQELHYPEGEAQAADSLGILYHALSEEVLALDCFQIALARYDELGNRAAYARTLSNIGNSYLEISEQAKALEYLQRSLAINEEDNQRHGMASNFGNIGNVYKSLLDNAKALEYYQKALELYQELGRKDGVAVNLGNIGNVYKNLANYPKALEYLQKSLHMNEELGSKRVIAGTLHNIGLVYQSLSENTVALEYYQKSMALNEELNNKSWLASTIGNIGNVYRYLGDYSKALEYLQKALVISEELHNKDGIAINLGNIGALHADRNFKEFNAAIAEEYLLNAMVLCREIEAKQYLYQFHKVLAELYRIEKRWEEADSNFQKYHALEKEEQSEEVLRQAELMEYRRKIEDSERDRQLKLARLEEQVRILHNILPPSIADRIVSGEKTIAESFENVSIFFSDIVNFTQLSATISPEELVELLNDVFTEFDHLARKYQLEKIKTIGDSYMAVCGVPEPNSLHAINLANFALDVQEAIKKFSHRTAVPITLRIGLHCGQAVAGVIGENKFAYDLWGDAVNTASRMESHGEPGKIHVSEEFKHAVETLHATSLQFIRRGEMEIKGKGMMRTYFLEKEER